MVGLIGAGVFPVFPTFISWHPVLVTGLVAMCTPPRWPHWWQAIVCCVQSLCDAPAVHEHARLHSWGMGAHSWGMGAWTGAPLLVALGDTLAQGSPRQVGVLDSGQLGESLSLSLA